MLEQCLNNAWTRSYILHYGCWSFSCIVSQLTRRVRWCMVSFELIHWWFHFYLFLLGSPKLRSNSHRSRGWMLFLCLGSRCRLCCMYWDLRTGRTRSCLRKKDRLVALGAYHWCNLNLWHSCSYSTPCNFIWQNSAKPWFASSHPTIMLEVPQLNRFICGSCNCICG